MFGLTEFTALYEEPFRQAIIPTFVLPFTIVGMILTSLATWVASCFGVELKAEGPKRLFEVLTRPKILLWTLLMNAFFYGAFAGWQHLSTSSRPLWLIEAKNQHHPSNNALKDGNALHASPETSKGSQRIIKGLETLWSTKIQGGVFGEIAAQGSSIFLGATSGKVFELDAVSGKTLRQFWLGQPVMTSPLIFGNSLFVGEGVHETHHSRYYKFDLESGRLIAAASSKGHIERTATVATLSDKKILLVPTGRDGVSAVDSESMNSLWKAEIGHVDSSPIADDDLVFVATGLEKGFNQDGTFAFALNLASGQVRWKKALPTSSWGKPFVWQDQVCFSIGDVYANTDYGQIACYDKATGQERGAINLSGAVISTPLLRGHKVILNDLNSTIYQIDLASKSIDWRIEVPHSGLSYASVVTVDTNDDEALVLPGKEGLYFYSRKNQKKTFLWTPVDGWDRCFSNILIANDLWYLADAKGKVRALRPIYKK